MIFDGFTFFNELDILDIRLHEMAPVVDRFILVEARQTFQGAPKPLVFEENRAQFEKFADKIIHVVCDFPDDVQALYPRAESAHWAREYYQRDQIARGLAGAKPDDLVIVSDVDEIISADKLRDALARRRPRELTVFEMAFYRYALNRRMKGEVWDRPRMLQVRDFTTAQDVRNLVYFASSFLKKIGLWQAHARRRNRRRCGIDCPIRAVTDAGWHISSLGGWRDYREKLDAFAHVEEKAKAAYLDELAYLKRLEDTTEVVPLAAMPAFVRENRERFAPYLAAV